MGGLNLKSANAIICYFEPTPSPCSLVAPVFSPPLAPQIPHNIPIPFHLVNCDRAALLPTLHQQLQHRGRVTLSGRGGWSAIGSINLVMQYIQAYFKDYPGGIFWIHGQLGNIEAQILEFVHQHLALSLPTHLDGQPLSLAQQVQWCWQHWQPADQVLLVLENGVGLTDTQGILPLPNHRFRFIRITTDPGFRPDSADLVIEGLSPGEAIPFLLAPDGLAPEQGSGGIPVQDEAAIAAQLSVWVEGNPLALQLIRAYWQQRSGQSLAELWQQLQTTEAHLTHQDTENTCPTQLRAICEVIWQALDPPAQEVAHLLSLFAPAAIPWDVAEWALQGLQETTDTWPAARTQLEAFGLVQSVSGVVETGTLHPWVREWLRSKLLLPSPVGTGQSPPTHPPGASLQRAFAAVFAGIAQEIPQTLSPDLVQALQPIAPHLVEVALHHTDWLSEEHALWPLIGLGRFYQGQGLLTLAEPWWQRSLTLSRQRLGKDHPDVAISLNNLALLYRAMGRHQEAETYYHQALEHFKTCLGEAHPGWVPSSHNLALLYRNQGRFPEAEELCHQALAVTRQWLGEEPVALVTSLHQLGELHRVQGHLNEAETYQQQALAVARRQLGKQHELVATSLHYLAEVYLAQGLLPQAATLHRQALTLRQRLLGKEDPLVAASLHQLAEVYRCQGAYRKAEPLYLQALQINQRSLGENHPTVLIGFNNLAVVYAHLNRFDQATQLFEEVLSKRIVLFGENHPETERTRRNLENVKLAQSVHP